MKPAAWKLFQRVLGYVWLCALGLALLVSALTTDRRARQVEEYASLCDPFGYLQIAQDTRQAVAARRLPDFSIESSHHRLLIDLMKSRGVPLRHWEDMVAPLCYHYSPAADHIGVQYPSGAGLMLALFPQGEALHRLDRLVIILFVGTGVAMLIVAAVKQTWLSAGFLILALTIGLEILARIDNASFSINAMFAPILLSGLCLTLAAVFRVDGHKGFYFGWVLTFFAGLFFGFAILVRLQIAFLLPGMVVLLWPVRWREHYKSGLAGFCVGVLLGGVLPVIINQSLVTGVWHQSTYGVGNTDPPTLESFWTNVHFYFDPGKPSQFNWALLVISVAYVGLFVCTRRSSPAIAPRRFLALSWPQLCLAALILWTIPMAYFLTHEVTGHHYPLAQTFCTLLLVALGSFRLEANSRRAMTVHISGTAVLSEQTSGENRPGQKGMRLAAFTLALIPGLFAISEAWSNYVPATAERYPRSFILPSELVDERAWVWADELSGTLWYYMRKPAHKINFTGPDGRRIAYQYVLDRGEPQYLIVDGPDMRRMKEEMVQFGASLEQRGEVDGYPYYLIHWPPTGPLKKS